MADDLRREFPQSPVADDLEEMIDYLDHLREHARNSDPRPHGDWRGSRDRARKALKRLRKHFVSR